MNQENDYFEQVQPFPDTNFFSLYNLKVLSHFLNYLPAYLHGNKYVFFKKIVHKILRDLSSTPEEEIHLCLTETLRKDKLHNPDSVKYLENGFIYPTVLYLAVRVSKPEVVVETGVHSGRSTSFILQALSDNNKGKLYSFDLGHDISYNSESGLQHHTLPERIEVGWLVPDYLKKRWELILGDSKKELLQLLPRLGRLDFFSHDGEHTDSNMMFEYNLAMKFLGKNGILMSDDVLFSQNGPKRGFLHQVSHYKSWINFSKDLKNSHIINYKVGYVTKP